MSVEPSPGTLTLSAAIGIAVAAHAGARDQAGAPYIAHPLRVMRLVAAAGGGVYAQILAVLHDVLEDTDVTEDDLRTAGASEELVADLLVLKKGPREPKVSAARRAAAKPATRLVKLADNTDNSDPVRLALVPEVDRVRLMRVYAQVRAVLTDPGCDLPPGTRVVVLDPTHPAVGQVGTVVEPLGPGDGAAAASPGGPGSGQGRGRGVVLSEPVWVLLDEASPVPPAGARPVGPVPLPAALVQVLPAPEDGDTGGPAGGEPGGESVGEGGRGQRRRLRVADPGPDRAGAMIADPAGYFAEARARARQVLRNARR